MTQAPPDDSPQSAYRWVIVFASAIMLCIAMGIMINGFSVFFIPLSEEFGWSRGSIAFINLSGLMGLAFGGIFIGRIAHLTSTRNLSLVGALVLSLCLYASSMATQLWHFYSLFFIAGFLGAGALFTPLITNVGNWFTAGAGLAIGIASAGQAVGQGGIPYAAALMISAYGWRETLSLLGIITLCVLLPLAMSIRQPQYNTQSGIKGLQHEEQNPSPLAPHIIIIWLSVAVIFCCTCMAVPLMHLVPLIQDRGIPLGDAGSVMFAMLLSGIIGRIAFGKLADLIGALPAYLIASLWQTLLVFGFIYMNELNSFYIFAVIYGFGYAGVMTTILVCLRIMLPLSKRAFGLGIVTFFGWVGHATGGYQGGLFFDLTGSYVVTYANAAIAGIINLMIVSALYFTIRSSGRPAPSGA